MFHGMMKMQMLPVKLLVRRHRSPRVGSLVSPSNAKQQSGASHFRRRVFESSLFLQWWSRPQTNHTVFRTSLAGKKATCTSVKFTTGFAINKSNLVVVVHFESQVRVTPLQYSLFIDHHGERESI